MTIIYSIHISHINRTILQSSSKYVLTNYHAIVEIQHKKLSFGPYSSPVPTYNKLCFIILKFSSKYYVLQLQVSRLMQIHPY